MHPPTLEVLKTAGALQVEYEINVLYSGTTENLSTEIL